MMGRLIDASNINNCVMMHKSDWGIFATDIGNAIDSIVMECPTVEAIPKADYENRLKADMVAMLTEIQVEIGEHIIPSTHTDSYGDGWSEGAEWCIDYIQEKIDKLKGE